MKETIVNNLGIIEKSIGTLDDRKLYTLVSEMVQALHSGRNIIASGLGKNQPVCEKFVGSLNSMGIDAHFLNTNSAVHGDIGIVKEGDVVVLLSKSGETHESVWLAKLLMERKANVWGIMFKENSSVEKIIGTEKTIVLSLEHEGDQWNIMPNNSTVVNLLLLQGIAMILGEKMEIPLEEFKKNHPGGNIGDRLKNA